MSQSRTQKDSMFLRLTSQKAHWGMNFFECKSGEYISALLICDGELHYVNDSSDEVNCDNMKK